MLKFWPFKRKEREYEEEENEKAPSSILGQQSLMNIIGPSYWSADDLMRENMKHKTYGIAAHVPPSGYPRILDTGIFQELLAQGNVDLTIDVVPRTRRETIAKYSDIDNLLDQVQFDEDRLYDVAISLIVYGDSERDMNRNFGTAADLLANEGISITPYAKRVKGGYMQTIPIGVNQATPYEVLYKTFNRESSVKIRLEDVVKRQRY
ncbi:hypothetical protein [Limosilactobacillus mucosae]|uniref:Uncharacterized protein n=1 Tax=Limosilactobacillus mucosae TaxID=97478 RepID=A0AAJ1HS32_LIMMU|nr:hypothetical protein [Limosilactobacillus mucosae]MDC2828519.1 hypothetical protein [Limosilactobacillus mucosae]MDC2834531.1 hypothetical protein [Limosilactobacillus mucosae]